MDHTDGDVFLRRHLRHTLHHHAVCRLPWVSRLKHTIDKAGKVHESPHVGVSYEYVPFVPPHLDLATIWQVLNDAGWPMPGSRVFLRGLAMEVHQLTWLEIQGLPRKRGGRPQSAVNSRLR